MCIVIKRTIVTRRDRIAFKVVDRLRSRCYQSAVPFRDRAVQLERKGSLNHILSYLTGRFTVSSFATTAGIYCKPFPGPGYSKRSLKRIIRVLIPKGTRVRLQRLGWDDVFTAERVRVLGMVR